MKIGVVKEIKQDESRVALTTAGVVELRRRGHEVLVETGAGAGSAMDDAEYEAAGATIVDVDAVWADAEMVLKVKEPLDGEYQRLSPGPDPVHLPAPRGGARADPRAVRDRRRVHRLRDGRDAPTAGCRCSRR